MYTVDAFLSFNLAASLLIFGKILTLNSGLLQRYSIPEPVVGGFLCVCATGILWAFFDVQVSFELELRDYLLLLFFSGLGLKSDLRTLIFGGKPLLILLALASGFIILQNFTGMGTAYLLGQDPKAGLMIGSISLTGGVGTTLAWAPIFAQDHGISNAGELGVAANTLGLIAACLIGGPIASFLIRSKGIEPSHNVVLDIGANNDGSHTQIQHFAVLWAILSLNITVFLGVFLDELISSVGITLPTFVSCLLAGIAIGNLWPLTPIKSLRQLWPSVDDALALISELSLGLFLIMALMGLQVWALTGALSFIFLTVLLQIILSVVFILFVVFPAMGRDYDAVVISAGFGGISLGSTATAVANMTAVSQTYGAAHQAFVIVPLVCGFFIDLVNALIISLFLSF